MATKERMNITIDPGIKEELTVRDDINASGAVNDFLKRFLSGETKDAAAKQIEIERKRERAKELQEQADQLQREADFLEDELQEERQLREEAIEEAIQNISVSEMVSVDQPVVDESEEYLERLASRSGASVQTLKQKAINRHQNKRNGTDPTYQ